MLNNNCNLPEPANQNFCEAVVTAKKPSLQDRIADAIIGFTEYDAFLALSGTSGTDRILIAREYADAILEIIERKESYE